MNNLFIKNRRQVYREWAEELINGDELLAHNIRQANPDIFGTNLTPGEHEDTSEILAALWYARGGRD